jgi:hypothetical protein
MYDRQETFASRLFSKGFEMREMAIPEGASGFGPKVQACTKQDFTVRLFRFAFMEPACGSCDDRPIPWAAWYRLIINIFLIRPHFGNWHRMKKATDITIVGDVFAKLRANPLMTQKQLANHIIWNRSR